MRDLEIIEGYLREAGMEHRIKPRKPNFLKELDLTDDRLHESHERLMESDMVQKFLDQMDE